MIKRGAFLKLMSQLKHSQKYKNDVPATNAQLTIKAHIKVNFIYLLSMLTI